MKFQFIGKFNQSEGYTILETLVALALLSIMTIPILFLINQILLDGTSMEKIYAINIAEQELEKVLLFHLDFEHEQSLLWNGKRFILSRKVRIDQGLLNITILVYRKADGVILIKLNTWKRHEESDYKIQKNEW